MLAKAVKIIGRIFFRPGRSVSFFSVDDNGFSFVHDLRNDPRRERGTGSRLFVHPNARGAAEIYLQPRETRFHAIN